MTLDISWLWAATTHGSDPNHERGRASAYLSIFSSCSYSDPFVFPGPCGFDPNGPKINIGEGKSYEYPAGDNGTDHKSPQITLLLPRVQDVKDMKNVTHKDVITTVNVDLFTNVDNGNGEGVFARSTATPEPASLVLFGSGLLGTARILRKRLRAPGTASTRSSPL